MNWVFLHNATAYRPASGGIVSVIDIERIKRTIDLLDYIPQREKDFLWRALNFSGYPAPKAIQFNNNTKLN
jgi:hypothetical protein